MVAKFQPPGRIGVFHTENGVLGFGEAPPPGEEDWDLINAGKKAITLEARRLLLPSSAPIASPWCAVVIFDVAILGYYQVAQQRPDLANWSTGPARACPRSVARWTLVHGAKRVAVITDHATKRRQAETP